jgi:hypothetical protein
VIFLPLQADGKFNKTCCDSVVICRFLRHKIAELHVCTSEGVVVALKTPCRFHGINKTTTGLLL